MTKILLTDYGPCMIKDIVDGKMNGRHVEFKAIAANEPVEKGSNSFLRAIGSVRRYSVKLADPEDGGSIDAYYGEEWNGTGMTVARDMMTGRKLTIYGKVTGAGVRIQWYRLGDGEYKATTYHLV